MGLAPVHLIEGGLGCRKNLTDDILLSDDAMDPLIDIFRAARELVSYFE